MNLNRFNEPQRQALLEILIMAMYCDSQLASAEDLRVQKVADSLGFVSPDERRNYLESLLGTLSKLPRSIEAMRSPLTLLARRFPNATVRAEAVAATEELLLCDHRFAQQESQFLNVLKKALGV